MSWYGERVYEAEYALARRVGKIVGRKMAKENTKVVKLRVRPDNPMANWFTSEFFRYTTPGNGGWYNATARKCFRSELYCGWVWEQSEEIQSSVRRERRCFVIVRSKFTIMFLNTMGVPDDMWEVLWSLRRAVIQLERSEMEQTSYDN
jgi:hypothetical protein